MLNSSMCWKQPTSWCLLKFLVHFLCDYWWINISNKIYIHLDLSQLGDIAQLGDHPIEQSFLSDEAFQKD